MSDRWIPVLAATVGVLGGIGGALVGGIVANQNQQDRFQDEQRAARADVRREIYATYLQAAESVVQKSAILNAQGLLDTREQQAEFIETEGVPFATAQAAVLLVAEDGVRDAADAIETAFEGDIISEEEWVSLRQGFIDRAQAEIFPSG